jgi:hypothetical protein
MRLAGWVPQDMREMIESIDPAAHIDAPTKPTAADIIATTGDQRNIEAPPPGRRLLATLTTVGSVLIAAVGVVIIRNGSGSVEGPAVTPPSSTVTTSTSATTHPIPEAAPPPAFPVSQKPRPLVLLGVTEIVSGFPDSDSKIAFMDGDIDLATTLPSAPTIRDGYPVMPAASAVRRITNVRSCCVSTSTRLRITGIRLVDQSFMTDRGKRSLPAWQIRFAGLPTTVTVLAVARSARYLIRGGWSTATVSNGGRALTIYFVAHHRATGPCDQGYRSFLSMSESSSAIRISVRVRREPPKSAPSGVICADVGRTLNASVAPVPGSPNTATIHLRAPVGNRLVVDAENRAYLVTPLK